MTERAGRGAKTGLGRELAITLAGAVVLAGCSSSVPTGPLAGADSDVADRANASQAGNRPSATAASAVARVPLAADGVARRIDGWRRGDLHFHSNYSDDALEQGGDWVGDALRIAEYYEDPIFQAYFPEYAENHLDFIALTDHRTIEGTQDLEFTSQKLILIPGEEFGSTGHAGALNLSRVESHSPTDGRTENEQIQWAIHDTIAQGGLFSINHPVSNDDLWFWDVEDYEAAEVWNTWWAAFGPPTPESVLDDHVANHGVENRFIRRAVQQSGGGVHGQYRAYFEAHLVAGIPLAPVGGGDRHMLVMPGHPTTYVKTGSDTPGGLIDGIRRRHTFVSRSPAGPQVLLSARSSAGSLYEMGDLMPAGQSYTLEVQVARAPGGLLRLISGPVIPGISREELLELDPLGDVLVEVPISSNDFAWTTTWAPAGERWIYAEVLESLDDSHLPEEIQDELAVLTRSMEFYGMRYGLLAYALLPLLNPSELLLPETCQTESWDVYRTTCVDVDNNYLGTIHLAEHVDRVMNLYREDNEVWDYAMGAISSALMVRSN